MGAKAVISVLCVALLGGVGHLAAAPACAAEPGGDVMPGAGGDPLRQYLSDPLQPPDAQTDGAWPPSPVPERLRKFYGNMRNPVPDTPEAVAKGRLLYGANCQVCHAGAPGGAAPDRILDTVPRDLTAPAFQVTRSDGEIFYAIQNGVRDTAMLPWGGRLSDREIWLLVCYVRHLAVP
ncbi:MAG: c-type cytochrome [Nitrospirae bacterium]|nr:c-type cytochrome [Nitrospirota bacterium]